MKNALVYQSILLAAVACFMFIRSKIAERVLVWSLFQYFILLVLVPVFKSIVNLFSYEKSDLISA